MENAEQQEQQTIKIPSNQPYMLITFESPGSALANINKSSNVLPAMQLGISVFMVLEAIYAFVQGFQMNQRIVKPIGRPQ